MKDYYFADKRDLIKWGVLLRLSKDYVCDRILQIAYYTESEFPSITIDTQTVNLPDEVISFFRNIKNITNLNSDVEIIVFDKKFINQNNRHQYTEKAIEFINKFKNERCIIFLDPDTGLEPLGPPDLTHVREEELRRIWDIIPPQSFLFIYQHRTNMAGRPWKEEKRKQFANAIDEKIEKIKIAQEENSNDVVFFYTQKRGNIHE